MNNIIERKEDLVEVLLEDKSFNHLTEGERAIVLELLESPEEYRRLQELQRHLHERHIITVPSPRSQLLGQLKKNIAKRKGADSFLLKNWSAPFYQVAAAIVLIVVLFVLGLNLQTSPRVEPEKMVIRDTVFVPTPADTIVVDRFVTKVVYVSSPPIRREETAKDEIAKGETEFEQFVLMNEYLKLVNNSHGYSLSEKDYLLDLNVQIQ